MDMPVHHGDQQQPNTHTYIYVYCVYIYTYTYTCVHLCRYVSCVYICLPIKFEFTSGITKIISAEGASESGSEECGDNVCTGTYLFVHLCAHTRTDIGKHKCVYDFKCVRVIVLMHLRVLIVNASFTVVCYAT